MAVDKTWAGTTDVWDFADNWEPSGIPAAADTVFIVSGSQDIAGATPASTSVARIVVGPKYTGSIGTLLGKLQIDTAILDFGGRSGTSYFKGSYTTVTVQDTASGSTALNLYGDYGTSETITTLRILGGRGTINIDISCDITTTIEQIGASGVTTNLAAATTIGASCTLVMDSGTFVMDTAIPTITVFGGELESNIPSVETITLLEVYDGRVRFNPTAACIITQLTMYGGRMYTSDSTAPVFTITNCTMHEHAVLDERSGLKNTLFQNPAKMEGGEIKYDIGREVTIS